MPLFPFVPLTETKMNSVERIKEFSEVPVEAEPIVMPGPPPEWPQKGKIVFENVKMVYRPGG